MLWHDFAVIFAGLGIGIGSMFEIIRFSVNEKTDSKVYTWTNFWLIFSGVIHCWIEFNFVFYRSNSLIKNGMDLYAAADYRYGDYGGMMESGTTAMELITALIDGPLCFIVAFAAVHDYSWRHPLQIILCVMQLYGLLWFVLQPIYSETGMAGHFSSDPVLFWVVAVGCNAPWAIFPTILLHQSFSACTASFQKSSMISKYD
ncbi:Emopamil-binding protein [Ochromonadaceae sp. CCMP2298]|nr:Emopamil-binding protein [Ochromonadaceae sp. CCMP2298]